MHTSPTRHHLIPQDSTARWFWGLLLMVLALRLLSMALYPILDTTEARYAEMARHMATNGSWLMPEFRPGEPFWGKPPLFAWLSAAAQVMFGKQEWALRLPHFLLATASLWLLVACARDQLSEPRRWLAALALASTPLFFATAGTVMTESGVLFSASLGMTGFWLCLSRGSKVWGLAFFAGLGIGMLAKGPVVVVMIGLPILMWLALTRQWHQLKALPWLSGLALAALICLPWYLAAERHSPGFLQYFLVGEHVLRFIQPGWQGDLYGTAHRELPGMIWLLWFQATAIWGVLAVLAWVLHAWRARRTPSRLLPASSDWQRYLLCWCVAPLLFFTFSGNILWTYVLTGLPAFALLLATESHGAAPS